MATIRVGNGATRNGASIVKGTAKGPVRTSSSSIVKRKPCKTCGGRR